MSQTITIKILDVHCPPENTEIDATTTAQQVCQSLCLRLKLNQSIAKYHTLFLIHSSLNSAGTGNTYCLRTLQPEECLLRVLETVNQRQNIKTKRHQKTNRTSCRWYFKDCRSAPVDTTDLGDVSGDSDSEDEEPIPAADILYLLKADRKGYLLKKSSKDPNLWRKRLCILTDKLWCINDKSSPPRALCMTLNNSFAAVESNMVLNIPFPVVVNGGSKIHQFRASSASDASSWNADISRAGEFTQDNGLIQLSEVIICDEESILSERGQQLSSNIIESSLFTTTLMAHEFYFFHDSVRDLPEGCSSSEMFAPYLSSSDDGSSSDGLDGDDDDNDSDDDEVLKPFPRGNFKKMHGSFEMLENLSRESPMKGGRGKPILGKTMHHNRQQKPAIRQSENSRSSPSFVSPYSQSMVGYIQMNSSMRLFGRQPAHHINRSTSISLRHRARRSSSKHSYLHMLHSQHAPLATALRFFSEVARFKNLFRYDNSGAVRAIWVLAMQIFNKYLTPVLANADVARWQRVESEQEEPTAEQRLQQAAAAAAATRKATAAAHGRNVHDTVKSILKAKSNRALGTVPATPPTTPKTPIDGEVEESRSESAFDVDIEQLEASIWGLNRNTIMRVHDIVFNNIRPCAYIPNAKRSAKSAVANAQNRNRASTGSSWFWGSKAADAAATPETPDSQSAAVPARLTESAVLSADETEVYINSYASFTPTSTLDPGRTSAQYEFIDIIQGPEFLLFDEVVNEMVVLIDKCNGKVRSIWQHAQDKVVRMLKKSKPEDFERNSSGSLRQSLVSSPTKKLQASPSGTSTGPSPKKSPTATTTLASVVSNHADNQNHNQQSVATTLVPGFRYAGHRSAEELSSLQSTNVASRIWESSSASEAGKGAADPSAYDQDKDSASRHRSATIDTSNLPSHQRPHPSTPTVQIADSTINEVHSPSNSTRARPRLDTHSFDIRDVKFDDESDVSETEIEGGGDGDVYSPRSQQLTLQSDLETADDDLIESAQHTPACEDDDDVMNTSHVGIYLEEDENIQAILQGMRDRDQQFGPSDPNDLNAIDKDSQKWGGHDQDSLNEEGNRINRAVSDVGNMIV